MNATGKQAGGFILQLMPFAEEEVIEKLEENIGKLPSVTTMLEEGNTPEEMIARVLDGFDLKAGFCNQQPLKARFSGRGIGGTGICSTAA